MPHDTNIRFDSTRPEECAKEIAKILYPDDEGQNITRIGEGASGVIFKIENAKGTFVLKIIPNGSDYHDITREARFLYDLQQKESYPYVVHLVDFVTTNNHSFFAYVMEYCEFDLEKLLYHERFENLTKRQQQLILSITPLDRLNILLCVAKGIDYLHKNKIIHRDIKPANIFIMYEKGCWIVKIGDLGTAAKIGSDSSRTGDFGKGIGTPTYMAPEILRVSSSDTLDYSKVDMYAFGLLSWEVLMGRQPFSEYKIFEFYQKVIEEKQRPDCQRFREILGNSVVGKACACLAEMCWRDERSRRPDFSVIVQRLQEIVTDYSKSLSVPPVEKSAEAGTSAAVAVSVRPGHIRTKSVINTSGEVVQLSRKVLESSGSATESVDIPAPSPSVSVRPEPVPECVGGGVVSFFPKVKTKVAHAHSQSSLLPISPSMSSFLPPPRQGEQTTVASKPVRALPSTALKPRDDAKPALPPSLPH